MPHRFQLTSPIVFVWLLAACGQEPITFEEAVENREPSSSGDDVGVEDPEDTALEELSEGDSASIEETDPSTDSESAEADSSDGGTDDDLNTGSDAPTSDPAGDSDTASQGGPAGLGQTCFVNVLGMVNIEGECHTLTAPCAGGTYPLDIKGNCVFGLVCCIATDQCNKHRLDIVTCRERACPASGAQVGCPDGKWCCITDL